MSNEELKPCPFCQKKVDIWVQVIDSEIYVYIQCLSYDCNTKKVYEKHHSLPPIDVINETYWKAVKAWNQRT